MSKVYTSLIAGGYSTPTNSPDYNLGNISWNTGDVVTVAFAHGATGASIAVTATGLTFTRLGAQQTNASWGYFLDVFQAVAAAGGSSVALHVTSAAGLSDFAAVVFSVAGADTADLWGTPAYTDGGNSITIAALRDTNSDAMGFWGGNGANIAGGAGFTVIDSNAAQAQVRIMAEYRNNVTAVTNGTSSHNIGFGVEIKAAAAVAAEDRRGFNRGIARGLQRGLSMVNLNGLWRPKDTRLVIPIGISLQGA